MVTLLYITNVLCAAGQSAIGKQYAKHGGHSLTFNLNKAAIGTILFFFLGLRKGFAFHLPTMCLGLAYGISLCLSMHTGFKALSIGPMALTSMIASFSLIIPFGFGICFWNESLTIGKVFGIVLLLISILLINAKKEKGFSLKWLLYAAITLLTNGICSVVQKLHQIKYPELYRTEFMFWALLCVFIILYTTKTIAAKNIQPFTFSILGTISGIMNCFANYIVLYLSATENASVIFPIISVANIMAAWVVGVLFFKERLKLIQAIGLIVGIASVVLLKL